MDTMCQFMDTSATEALLETVIELKRQVSILSAREKSLTCERDNLRAQTTILKTEVMTLQQTLHQEKQEKQEKEDEWTTAFLSDMDIDKEIASLFA